MNVRISHDELAYSSKAVAHINSGIIFCKNVVNFVLLESFFFNFILVVLINAHARVIVDTFMAHKVVGYTVIGVNGWTLGSHNSTVTIRAHFISLA